MKKYLSYLFLLIVISACNGGAATGTNYANFEIIDQQTVSGTANETVLAALSTHAFNAYNPILGFQTESGNTLSLGANDGIAVSINNSQNLVPLTSLALGFYNYINPAAINYANSMNFNNYNFVLNYNGNSTNTTMANFPRIYVPQGGTCTTVANPTTGVNDTVCTVVTTNTVIPYGSGTVLTYKLTGTLTNTCLGSVTNAMINQDTVKFQNCQIFNNPQIQLQIMANIPVSNTSGNSFNMQGQYYFLSPLVSVTKQ